MSYNARNCLYTPCHDIWTNWMKRQCRLDTDYDEVSNKYSIDFEVRLSYSVNPILAFYQYLRILMNIIKYISEIHNVTIFILKQAWYYSIDPHESLFHKNIHNTYMYKDIVLYLGTKVHFWSAILQWSLWRSDIQ